MERQKGSNVRGLVYKFRDTTLERYRVVISGVAIRIARRTTILAAKPGELRAERITIDGKTTELR